jgi:Integrase
MKKINKTKLPKIIQLPSGSYTVRLYSHTDDTGKDVYKSITNPDYDEVVRLAAQFKVDKKQEKIEAEKPDKIELTLGQAMDAYIESKDAVLSPSTVREYKRTRKTYLQDMMGLPLSKITPVLIQQEMNAASRDLAPKSVRNIHGFLSAVLATYKPEMKLLTTLPKKIKPDIQIPTENEMKCVFEHVRGTDMEIPIYLAACCGLRRSEIVALDWTDVNLKKRTLTVRAAVVENDKGEYVRKGTKTTAGKRTIKLFSFVAEVLESSAHKTGPVVNMTGYTIYNKWRWIINRLQLPRYRFHDLRHYAVSVMLALNVPKNYIADYVGHETENMIDEVYGHIMKERKTTVEADLEKYYKNVLLAKYET